MANPLISVVIPNWNGKKFLAGCLDSLLAQTYEPIEVVIVDNGSKDGSVEYLQENYPQVKLVTFPVNTGFSPAVNAGIKASTGEMVALLNNDTVVEPTWMAELIKAMDEHPEAGSAGCKMLAYDDHALLDGAGDGYRRGGLARTYWAQRARYRSIRSQALFVGCVRWRCALSTRVVCRHRVFR